MTEAYAFDIGTLLADSRPDSILSIGPNARALVTDYLEQRAFLGQPCPLVTLEPAEALAKLSDLGRFDLGIVADTLEQLEKVKGSHLIASLRDVHTARFCVVVTISTPESSAKSQWTASDCLGLGMILVNAYEQDSVVRHMYKYDIATYKSTPEWLNSSDWANPELWDKYRW
ncbi:MAG: DUF6231 family protein [Gammaproteobacteria bacterium]|nr:DUF6231 family protein [Gammaproteobacteria bacterium]